MISLVHGASGTMVRSPWPLVLACILVLIGTPSVFSQKVLVPNGVTDVPLVDSDGIRADMLFDSPDGAFYYAVYQSSIPGSIDPVPAGNPLIRVLQKQSNGTVAVLQTVTSESFSGVPLFSSIRRIQDIEVLEDYVVAVGGTGNCYRCGGPQTYGDHSIIFRRSNITGLLSSLVEVRAFTSDVIAYTVTAQVVNTVFLVVHGGSKTANFPSSCTSGLDGKPKKEFVEQKGTVYVDMYTKSGFDLTFAESKIRELDSTARAIKSLVQAPCDQCTPCTNYPCVANFVVGTSGWGSGYYVAQCGAVVEAAETPTIVGVSVDIQSQSTINTVSEDFSHPVPLVGLSPPSVYAPVLFTPRSGGTQLMWTLASTSVSANPVNPAANDVGTMAINVSQATITTGSSMTMSSIKLVTTLHGRFPAIGVPLNTFEGRGSIASQKPCVATNTVFIPTRGPGDQSGLVASHFMEIFSLTSDHNLSYVGTIVQPDPYYSPWTGAICSGRTVTMLKQPGMQQLDLDFAPISAVTVADTVGKVGSQLSISPVITGSAASSAHFSVSPALPSPLSLDSVSGSISGTPTSALAATRFTLSVSTAQRTILTSFLLTIQASGTPGTLNYGQSSVVLKVQQEVSLQPTGALNTDSFSISPQMPAGLIFNTATAAITGRPIAPLSQTTFSISATNADTTAVVGSLSFVVDAELPSFAYSPSSLRVLVGGSPNLAPTLYTSSSIINYTVSPPLPAGLMFNFNTGAITGNAASASAYQTYVVTGYNAQGASTAALGLSVSDPPLTFSYGPSDLSATVGNSLPSNAPRITFAFAPGTAVAAGQVLNQGLTFSVSPTLPAPLTIDGSSGVISGNVPLLSRSEYTVTATIQGQSRSTSVWITGVAAAPSSLTYTSLAAVVHVPVMHAASTFTSAPDTAVTVTPALPAGLYVDSSNGAIVGTPTQPAGLALYTVRIGNNAGSATAQVAISVSYGQVTSFTYSSNPLRVGAGETFAVQPIIAPSSGSVSRFTSAMPPNTLRLDPATGVVSGSVTALGFTNITVTAHDRTGGSINATLAVLVVPVAPTSLQYAMSSITVTAGSALPVYSPIVFPATATGITYTISPAVSNGLDFTGGVVSGTLTNAAGAVVYTITASNAGGSAVTHLTVTVLAAPPTLSYSVPSAIALNALTTISATVTGTGVTYSSTPALPGSFAFKANGDLEGTLTAALLRTTYLITAKNAGGSATTAVTLGTPQASGSSTPGSFNATLTALTYAAMPSYFVGKPLSVQPFYAGASVVSFGVDALPSGLSFNSATGVISGSPAAPGTVNTTVTAFGVFNALNTTILWVFVEAPVTAVTYGPSPIVSLIVNQTIVTALTPTVLPSHSSSLSFSVTPSLPEGLGFSTSTGAISGRPKYVSSLSRHLVTVTNSGGSFTAAVDLRVVPVAPSFSYGSTTAVYTVGVPTSNFVVSTGGAVAAFSISPTLPDGLQLNSQGTISGTPLAVSPHQVYLVTGTNEVGSVQVPVEITVLSNVTTPNVTYGAPYSLYKVAKGDLLNIPAPTVLGSLTPWSFSIFPELPSGITLNSATGSIFGTTEQTDPFGTLYTVTAKFSVGTAVAPVRIQVDPFSSAVIDKPTEAANSAETKADTATDISSAAISICALLIILLVVYLCFQRRRERQQDQKRPAPDSPPQPQRVHFRNDMDNDHESSDDDEDSDEDSVDDDLLAQPGANVDAGRGAGERDDLPVHNDDVELVPLPSPPAASPIRRPNKRGNKPDPLPAWQQDVYNDTTVIPRVPVGDIDTPASPLSARSKSHSRKNSLGAASSRSAGGGGPSSSPGSHDDSGKQPIFETLHHKAQEQQRQRISVSKELPQSSSSAGISPSRPGQFETLRDNLEQGDAAAAAAPASAAAPAPARTAGAGVPPEQELQAALLDTSGSHRRSRSQGPKKKKKKKKKDDSRARTLSGASSSSHNFLGAAHHSDPYLLRDDEKM